MGDTGTENAAIMLMLPSTLGALQAQTQSFCQSPNTPRPSSPSTANSDTEVPLRNPFERDVSPPPAGKMEETRNIREILAVDARKLSFGAFFPGKIFRCILEVKNLSQEPCLINLHFEQTKVFSSKTLLREFFPGPSKPRELSANSLPNSEAEHACWYLMLMTGTKSLEKTLNGVLLPPGNSIEVGVVVKAPPVSRAKKLYAMLSLSLDSADETIPVFLAGEVETPRLECCRELIYVENQIHVIPVVVRFEEQAQRMRIPFRNGCSQEIELMLSIMPFPGSGSAVGDDAIMTNVSCVPNVCKLAAGALGAININVSYDVDDSEDEEKDCETSSRGSGKKREQKVLIAKVRGTQMIYYYVLDFTFIVE